MTQATFISRASRRMEGYVGASNGSDAPLSFSVDAVNRTLVAIVSGYPTVSGVSRNGQVFTLVKSENGIANTWSHIYILTNPTVGIFDITVGRTNIEADLVFDVQMFAGVDQTTPVASSVSTFNANVSSPHTLAMTIPADGLGVSGIATRISDGSVSGAVKTADSPQVLSGNTDGACRLTASYLDATGATTMGYSWASGTESVTHIGLTLNPAVPPGDTTAPTLSVPLAAQTGPSTATGGVTTNEANGSLYAVVTTSATKPTAAQVKAGQNNGGTSAAYAGNQTVSSAGAKTTAATGLTAATGYYWHYMHEDAAANQSTVATSAMFTTATAPDTDPPVLSSPTGVKTGSNGANIGASTTEANGTMFVCVKTTNTAPTADEIIAGTGFAAAANAVVSATGAKTVAVTGLTPATNYYGFAVHRDAQGNKSNVVSSTMFTTDVLSTGSLVTGPIFKEDGTLAAAVLIHWNWIVGARVGDKVGKAVQQGSGTTASDGKLTVTGITAGDGEIEFTQRGATPAQDLTNVDYLTAV